MSNNTTEIDIVPSVGRVNNEALSTANSLLLAFGCLAMALGVLGNVGVLWIFRDRCFLGESTRANFRLLAVADLAVTLISLSRYLTLLGAAWDIRSVSNILCRVHTFAVYWSTDWSGWIVCLIATERLLAVLAPTKRFGARLMVGIVAGLAVGAAVKNHCLLYMMSWRQVANRIVCGDNPEYNFETFILCDLTLRILLPSLYLLAVNGSLLCRYACCSAGGPSQGGKEVKAFRMLFGISVYFFVSMLPSRLVLLYQIFNRAFASSLQAAYSGLILLSYTNNCFALYIYALTSPSVRRLLQRDLAACCCRCLPDRRVAPQAAATVAVESTQNAID